MTLYPMRVACLTLVLMGTLAASCTQPNPAGDPSVAAVPVRCGIPGPAILAGEEKTLVCRYGAGTWFDDERRRVPDGWFFLATDIVVTPDGGLEKEALTDVRLTVVRGDANLVEGVRLRGVTTASYGDHYTSPALVLQAGDVISLSAAHFADVGADVNVHGVLVRRVDE